MKTYETLFDKIVDSFALKEKNDKYRRLSIFVQVP